MSSLFNSFDFVTPPSPWNLFPITQKFSSQSFCGASAASHTIVSAPSSTERVAPCPPISVRTHPGQTEFTANFGNAVASCDVTSLSAVFEIQQAGDQPSAPPVNCSPPLETLITRGALLFLSKVHERACHAQSAERICLKWLSP